MLLIENGKIKEVPFLSDHAVNDGWGSIKRFQSVGNGEFESTSYNNHDGQWYKYRFTFDTYNNRLQQMQFKQNTYG